MTASGILELTPADQVVTVSTSILLTDLRSALREVGQDLPLAEGGWRLGSRRSQEVTLKELLDWNLPHTHEGGFGTWRDWVLGAKMRTASGLVGKSGARVVKSVAGFDVHRLFIGARGTLGELVEVHLKTVPAGTVREDRVRVGDLAAEEVTTIVRVPRQEFAQAAADLPYYLADEDTATFWTRVEWRSGKVWLPDGPFIVNPETARLMLRAKTIFDPQQELPPLEIETR